MKINTILLVLTTILFATTTVLAYMAYKNYTICTEPKMEEIAYYRCGGTKKKPKYCQIELLNEQ